MIVGDLFRKLQDIKNKLKFSSSIKTKIIVISDKIDVFYDDILDKVNYNITLNSFKTLNNNIKNTLEIEKVFTNSTASKIEYYQSVLAKFNGDDDKKNQMEQKISDLKSDVGQTLGKFKDKTKANALKRLITSEFKQPTKISTPTGKQFNRSKDTPIIHYGDLKLFDLSLNVSIVSHPAIEWTNWKISNEQNYLILSECVWSKKGKKQTINFKLNDETSGVILSSLYDSYELTLCTTSIPQKFSLNLTSESTDPEPFKNTLNIETKLSSMSVSEIITED
jgi:hypothetical protein